MENRNILLLIFLGEIFMIIRDENGKVVGSVEFSKEEMKAFSNEELFLFYAKTCLENLVRLHEINKNGEVKINGKSNYMKSLAFIDSYERLHSQKSEQPSNNDDSEEDLRNFKTSVI